jgi:peptide/nickel transport system substrate-binding protein/oligopeptide transport system substrate-binding protein
MSSPPDITSRFGGVYRRPLTNDPSLLDPARTTDVYANTVVNQLFDGLVQFDSDLNPIPAIAGFWEASLDGLTWTFHLRKNVEFHHGREVTAGDFVYSFTRILDPAIQSPVAELFKYIQGAEDFRTGKTEQIQGLKALGSHTLEIRLREPYAPFLSILAMANAKVLPREAVEKLGEQFAFQPVGSGPFQFVRWERNAEIVLQSYNYYYEGRPFLDQIVFKIGKQDVENLSDFLEGELEETIVPGEKVTEIRESSLYRPYIRRRIPTLHLLYVGFNTRKEPFINPKVRQAFNYAINKEAIIREIIKQGSIIAKGILPPGMPGYNPDLVEYYYNPDLAKQLLSEAGYPGGKGIPIIDLWSSSRDESTAKVLEAYKKDLATLGVTVTIHQAPDWPSFTKLLEEGKLSMFRLAWYADIPDPDNFFFPLLYSQSKTNRTFYQNPQVDQLLEQARRETEYLKRMEIYRRVERIAVSDAPWITQNHRVFEYLYQPYVQGVELNSLGPHYIPMKKIWLQRAKEQQEKRNP